MDFLAILGCDTHFISELRRNNKTDQDNLHMKFSALNIVFTSLNLALPFLHSRNSLQGSVKPGPSRATAGPGDTFSQDPKHFHGAPLGRKFLNFFFQNGTFWRILYFWPTVGPPNVAGPRVANPLPHSLDGPASNLSITSKCALSDAQTTAVSQD